MERKFPKNLKTLLERENLSFTSGLGSFAFNDADFSSQE